MDDLVEHQKDPSDKEPGVRPGVGLAAGDAGRRSRKSVILTALLSTLGFLLVIFALVAPNEITALTPISFLRIPLEGIVGAALLLALPAKASRILAVVAGVVLGLVLALKIVDTGFFLALSRPFNPLLDWYFLGAGVEYLKESGGRAGATGAIIAAVLLILTILAVMVASVLRLNRLLDGHRRNATRVLAALTVVWITAAAFNVRIDPKQPIAADSATTLVTNRIQQVRTGLHDQQVFAATAAADPFGDTPGDQLLTALRGKDVVICFVESYGRVALEHPAIAPPIDELLDEGTRRLETAGFASRSAFLTSPTTGGGSWLAHGTLLSGAWTDTQQRYNNVITSDRVSLNRAFQRAGWRTVIVMPALTKAWPEGRFFAADRIYGPEDLGYRGPKFGFAPTPDQYTLAFFERLERAAPDRKPLMAEIALVSSHSPWTPTPTWLNWTDIGDGSGFQTRSTPNDSSDTIFGDADQIRGQYQRAVENSLRSVISYVENYGNRDLVMVFVGDHQPAPLVTGEGEGGNRDVPITVLAQDPAVLDRVAGWGWQNGLNPAPDAPVWRMDEFRDRFLRAFE